LEKGAVEASQSEGSEYREKNKQRPSELLTAFLTDCCTQETK
tara:strand:- start:531 stop:656 length:126 start_codon:yes stop_codon:yes gene_type:complete